MTQPAATGKDDRRLPLTPFAEGELSPTLLRAVGPAAPPPLRQMAARGLAPLPPAELVVALYQLSLSSEELLAKTAAETVGKLAEPVLRGALQAPQDARVLDFLVRALYRNKPAIELLLRQRGLHDLTLEFLAAAGGVDELDLIAQDEARLLRCPEIIAAFYMNPKARPSTALRLIELAARNQVTVDIPGFEDLVASLQGVTITAEDDAKYQAAMGTGDGSAADAASAEAAAKAILTQEDIEQTQQDEEGKPGEGKEAEKKKERFEDLAVPFQIRAATLGNAFDRSIAIRSRVRLVSMAAIRSPALSINEVVKFASNRALQEDVIRYISNQKDWTQLPAVRLALINNNKCPLGTAVRFLTFLSGRDLKAVSRSKNVPGTVAKAAKTLISKRETKS